MPSRKSAPNRATIEAKYVAGRIQDSRNLQRDADSAYVVSYGGGVNSTGLVPFLIKNGFPLDHVVFSNTGNEMPETIAYLGVMKEYLDRHGVPLHVVSVKNNDSLSDRCEKRRVIPSEVWRWCTRDMKVGPIHAFYRGLKTHVYQYMGIDCGEVRRMKPPGMDNVTNLYPLIDHRIDRAGCIESIKKAGLPVPIKSGCDICPFNNIERWNYIYRNHPDLYKRAMALEENSKHFGKQNLGPGNLTLRELEKIILDGKDLPDDKKDGPCGGECMV